MGDILARYVTKVLPFGALVEVEGVSGLLRDGPGLAHAAAARFG
jgi:predicted RNA-binding protein with RPS1 domain